MKRILLTTLLLFTTPASAEGPQAQMYNKPVLCAGSEIEAVEMLSQIKLDRMTPLMYWRGNSFNGDGSKFYSDFFILYDHEESQLTVIEQQDNGFTCLVSGGTGLVSFLPHEIKPRLKYWSDE